MTEKHPVSEYIKSLQFVAFDTETTGIWAPAHRIVEIGAVKFKLSDEQTETFASLVNPERSIPEEVIRVHGITDDMVTDSPTIEPVLRDFIEFCGEAVLVAHHAMFDISFVACELKRVGLSFGDNIILDTIDLHQRLSPGLPSYSLLSLVSHYGIAKSQDHRALADAVFVKELVRKASPFLGAIQNEDWLRETLRVHSMESWSQQDDGLPEEFEDIQKAILHELRLRIEYSTNGQPPLPRVIRPKASYRLGSRLYINAWCERSRAERTFRLDRIVSRELLD